MNFYKHHLGDYAKDTGHLSLVEHGAYRRMIDVYYSSEKPLPADAGKIGRLIGARSKDEKEAVSVILEEFFELAEDGWHNKRCDEELAKYGAQADTNRRIAAEREAKKKATNRSERSNESLNEPLHESFNEQGTLTSVEREPSHKPLAISQKNLTPPTPLADAKGVNGHKRRQRKPTTPCPVAIDITDAMYDWANGKGLSDDQVAHETETMLSHHTAKGTEWTDWQAAWRTWMLNAVKYSKQRGARQ